LEPEQCFGQSKLFGFGTQFQPSKKGLATYQYENLSFGSSFSGNRHIVNGLFRLDRWTVSQQSSLMKSDGTLADSKFLRNQSQVKYHFGKNWVGGSVRLEDNQEKIKSTNLLSTLSQRFLEYGAFTGRGDSTKVFVELGYLHRVNDSLQNGFLNRVNTSQSYYLKSKLIQTEKSDLSVYANYRNLEFTDPSRTNEPSLNSRILYNDRFFDQLIQVTAAYETTSGTIAQQEFTYLEVDPAKAFICGMTTIKTASRNCRSLKLRLFPTLLNTCVCFTQPDFCEDAPE
jgi:hypothetical protein